MTGEPLRERLRRWLLPRDPFYRRESGAGRRIVIVSKLSALVAVLLAYLAWAIFAWVRTEASWLEVLATTAVSWFFCLLAFVLGVQSVRNEVPGTSCSQHAGPGRRRHVAVCCASGRAAWLSERGFWSR